MVLWSAAIKCKSQGDLTVSSYLWSAHLGVQLSLRIKFSHVHCRHCWNIRRNRSSSSNQILWIQSLPRYAKKKGLFCIIILDFDETCIKQRRKKNKQVAVVHWNAKVLTRAFFHLVIASWFTITIYANYNKINVFPCGRDWKTAACLQPVVEVSVIVWGF